MNISIKAFHDALAIPIQQGELDGRLTVSPDGRSVSRAPTTFRDKVLQFLSFIPLLNQLSVIHDYVAKIAIENKHALAIFARALGNRYGPKATEELLRLTQITSGKPLTARAIRMAEIHGSAHLARALARKVSIRIWGRAETKSSFGHASLTLQSGLSNNSGRLLQRQANRVHVSLWPAETPSGIFDRRPAALVESYKDDRASMLKPETAQRLSEGVFKPKAGQKPIKINALLPEHARPNVMGRAVPAAEARPLQWGQSAMTTAIPLAGKNFDRSTQTETMTTFGLNEHAFIQAYDALRNDVATDKLGFRLFSKTENCASACARVLAAAGADVFLPIGENRFYREPNEMSRYGEALRTRIDELNGKANQIATFMTGKEHAPGLALPGDKRRDDKIGREVTLGRNPISVARTPADVNTRALRLLGQATSAERLASCDAAEKAVMHRLTSAVQHYLAATSPDFAHLQGLAIALVESMHPVIEIAVLGDVVLPSRMREVMETAHELLIINTVVSGNISYKRGASQTVPAK